MASISDINIYDIDRQQTVGEWLNQWDIAEDFTARKFLDLIIHKSKLGSKFNITNLGRIRAKYNVDELKELDNKTPDDVILKVGTQVGLQNSVIKRTFTKILPDISQLTDFTPFIADQLKTLLNDPNYYSEIRDVNNRLIGRADNNDISVYAWIRSIDQPGSMAQNGTWYNISAFVEDLVTSVNKGVGSFNITLSPVTAAFDKEEGWHLTSLRGYAGGSVREEVITGSLISRHRNEQDNFVSRENHFFKTVLRENDLIYIRFEKLAMEKEKDLIKRAFGAQDIPGKVYDMIGLIDTVQVGTTDRTLTTKVQGRDLMKLLIEDGSMFFPEQIGQNIFSDKDSKLAKRNLVEFVGNLLITTGFSFKPISTILKFIFNKFSNLGMVPSSVFSGYGDRAIKEKYELQSTVIKDKDGRNVIELVNDEFLNQERQGVWTIIEIVFDVKSGVRVLADNTIATDNGSIINTIRKFCQEPFVEFYGDTYGDKYYFIVRKMPFDEKGYRGLVYGDSVSENSKDGINVSGKSTGKKKPFGEKAKRANLNKAPQRTGLISSLVIDIDEVDVRSDSLSYSDEAYSWYRVIPRGYGVDNNTSSFLLAPVIPLDEYAEIWGNKTYSLEYNYCPSEFIDDSFVRKEMKYVESQTFLDLQYVIQSHAYLPFTRMGTITINGNRTIKRGMFVYHKAHDEVYYVDEVMNVRTLTDRTTTLRVSRGMRSKYIKGVKVDFPNEKGKLVSYFNIVNTKIENNATINSLDFLKNWKVDKDVFNFFIQGRQWETE